MMKLYEANDRGSSTLDWLDARHSFSFAGWVDPERMGFRSLRVLNEDRIAPGKGFGSHPHRDMEIVTVVLAGALEHRDSSGSRAVLHAGDVQHMSAGTGVVHSEWNASQENPVELIQIWIQPEERGIEPGHTERRRAFPVDASAATELRILASRDKDRDSLELHQDATISAGRVDSTTILRHQLTEGRGAWIQAVHGGLIVNGTSLSAGDGLAIENEHDLEFAGDPEGTFLLFDLG